MSGGEGVLRVLELVQRLVLVVRMGNIQRLGRMSRAAANLVQAQIPRDGEQPGGKLRRDPVAIGRFVNLHEDVLRHVLGFRGVAQRPVHQIDHRLFVLVHQLLEGVPVAALDTEHQRGVGIRIRGHEGAS